MGELLVKLQIYEGPLDLLLHLIKKNEVDLDDIPLALITAQYLEYLELMESLNIELAADFLLMAATLTQIKSRLLLPKKEDESENEVDEEFKNSIIDPLMERLRQGFKNYRDVAEALRHRQQLGSDVFARGAKLTFEDFSESEDNLKNASLYDLIDAFRAISEKKIDLPGINFVVETKTITERISEIQTSLKEIKKINFKEACLYDRNLGEYVLSFLAVLELARTGFLRLYQNKEGDITLFLADPDAENEKPENSFSY